MQSRGSRVACVLLVALLAWSLTLGAPVSRPAPARAAARAPISGGTLTIAFVAQATHLDVNSVNLPTLNELAHYFYETLYDRDAHGNVKGLLVKEDRVTTDGLTWIWRLRPNVRFHDGSPFNAAAVKWNLDRKFQKRQPLFELLPFKSWEVVDDLTVSVTLTRPAPNLRSILVAKTFSMYSPSFAQRVGDDGMKSQASGTGPFMVTEFRPNEAVRMRKNARYWQSGLPHLDEIVFRVVPDINARAIMLDEAGLPIGPGGVRMRDGRPLSLELVTRKGAIRGDFEIAELVQGMLRAVGIDVRLTVLDVSTFIPRTWLPPERATYDLVNLTVGTFTGDAEYVLRTFYHSTAVAPRFFNWAFYANPIVDSLIDESVKATTHPGRNKIYYSQIIKQVFRDAPVIMLIDVTQQVAMRETVHGVYLENASNNWPAKYAWKEKQ